MSDVMRNAAEMGSDKAGRSAQKETEVADGRGIDMMSRRSHC